MSQTEIVEGAVPAPIGASNLMGIEDDLKCITRRLVEAVRPDRIYLFGSFAYGEPDADSDVDLFIVVPPNGQSMQDLYVAAHHAIQPLDLAVDLVVRWADEFDRRSGWQANFEHTIRNRGKLLYGVDGIAFAKEWLEKAATDRDAAARLMAGDRPLLDTAAFHCQQAAEKTLKGFLVYHNEPFEKIHDLGKLCELCAKLDAGFADKKEPTTRLNRFAVQLRYPDTPNPSTAEVEEAMRIVEEIWQFVLSRLPGAAYPTGI